MTEDRKETERVDDIGWYGRQMERLQGELDAARQVIEAARRVAEETPATRAEGELIRALDVYDERRAARQNGAAKP